ncbi:MAG: anaerobic ribonucleoside-triphosphate reductase activating protein [Bacteroidales bacterium]|nr:anaerobic ribonucleoside-triphosphate reductase activating protein [Bacteroidales bacterium]
MLKFLNNDIVFQEIPDEVVLAVNLTGCPCRCPGCHSPYLWADIGEPLTYAAVDALVSGCNSNITCLAFMGGDADAAAVNDIMHYVRGRYPSLHTAWYSGRTILSQAINLKNFDYIKLGPYLAHLGALRCTTTNQRLYYVIDGRLEDMTHRFWR